MLVENYFVVEVYTLYIVALKNLEHIIISSVYVCVCVAMLLLF